MLHQLIELLAPPTSAEWYKFLFVLAGLIILVVLSELIRKHFRWSAEVTRKFVHISVGVMVFFAPKLFQSAVIPLALALCAVIVMIFAVRSGLLVGMHSTTRFSYGTVFYPLSFFILIILFWNRHPEIISLSMLGLAFGDAAAAIVGESLASATVYHLTSDKKSIEGSLTMFVITMVSIFVGALLLRIQGDHSIMSLLLIASVAATVATAWESLSSKGLDNFTVPLSIAFVLYYFIVPSPFQDISRFTIGIMLSIFIAVISHFMRFLSSSGAVTTFLLASLIFGLGGWKWTMPILIFFIFSSMISKLGKQQKQRFEGFFEKTSTRDWGQVAANGGIAGIFMLMQYFWPEYDFYPFYLGAVAAVAADTWGTEIGIWFHGKTISLTRLHIVEPGTNGGVSLAGFVGGAIGSLIVSVSAMMWLSTNRVIWISTIAGITGSLIDSILGGTIQATYRCATCNKQTERKIHCDELAYLIKGFQWMNNDVVNSLCALTGAGIVWLLNY